MLLRSATVLENIDEGNLSKELEIAKFRNYSRENFSHLIRGGISFEDFMNNSARFYSINLPPELSDYFIRDDLAHYFVLSSAPVLKSVEEYLLNKIDEHGFVSNYREVKNYYLQWILQRNPKDKHYYSSSIVNAVERNFSYQSFYNLILYGILCTYEKSIYNPTKAFELFDRAKDIVTDLNIAAVLKTEILYLIHIYRGFVKLKEFEYTKSLDCFSEAISLNKYGVTAFFYSALCTKNLNDFDTSYDFLREVLEFDQMRFKFAISFNHLALFNFFYENAVFYNVFVEEGFAQLLPDIDFLIKSHFSDETQSMEITYSKLINLNNLRIKEFFDKSVEMEIKFLKSALDQYQQKKTGLIRIVEQIFREKLVTLIEYIRNLIESHYFDQIKEDIMVFDKQIDQNKKQLERIQLEMEDSSKKIKRNVEEAAENLEEFITERSKHLEEKIRHIDEDPRYNPSQVFYSSMLFTVFVSFLIFFVIGVITSIVGYGDEIASARLGIQVGLKWSGITFAVGIFISIFSTLSSFWEKSSERKNLIAKLNQVKNEESEEREYIREDSERKTFIYQKKFDERIKTQEKIIENFLVERQQHYEQKYKIAKKEIDLFVVPLNQILKSLSNSG